MRCDGFKVASFIITLLIILVIQACSGDKPDSGFPKGTGSATFSIQWPDNASIEQSGRPREASAITNIDCASLGVATVSATFTDSGGTTIALGTWACSAHTGRVDSIPEGSGYKIVVRAKNSTGNDLYRGERSGITIIAGQTTNIGTVSLDPIGGTSLTGIITSPSGNQTITVGQSVNFQGSASGGTAPYTYQWNFGGGASNSLVKNPGNVTFNTTGNYTVTFQVTDANLATNSTSVTIIVNAQQTIPFSNYLSFDGGDRIIIPDSLSLSPAQITVETWVLLYSLSTGAGGEFFICKGGDRTSGAYILAQGLDVDKSFGFELAPYTSGYIVSPQYLPLETNRWYHVAGSYDRQTMKLYVDGVLQGSKDIGSVKVGNASPLYLSYDDVGGFPYYLSGCLAEVRIWDVARSASDIQSDMNSILTGSESGLVGYWRLNDGSGQVAHDSTSNGNNGQLGSTSGIGTDDPTWK